MITDRDLMEQATDHILTRMRREGYYEDAWHLHRLYDDPTVWHINNGWCAQWARRVRRLIPRAQVIHDEEHSFVELDGRYYDAEELDGVDDPQDLPFYRDVPRLV